MTAYLQLQRWEQQRVSVSNKGNGFRVYIVAQNAVGMPNEVFGCSRSLIDADTGLYDENYEFFCSPWDLVTWPVNTPDPAASPAYYRKSVCDVILPSQHLAEEFWTRIKWERDNLIAALTAMNTLQLLENYPP